MSDIKFRVWHKKERKMYFRGYQKWFWVLLCDDDLGSDGGRGIPVKRASYNDCHLFEWTGLTDKNGKEIYEGDRIYIHCEDGSFEDTVGFVPDSFGSGTAHPLQDIFSRHGISGKIDAMNFEVV